MTEDEMVGYHHQPNGHESEETPGNSHKPWQPAQTGGSSADRKGRQERSRVGCRQVGAETREREEDK